MQNTSLSTEFPGLAEVATKYKFTIINDRIAFEKAPSLAQRKSWDYLAGSERITKDVAVFAKKTKRPL